MKDRVKTIRSDVGITQAEFGERLGLSRNYIAQIEMGAKEPSDRTIRDICRIYGVNETWLRTGAGEMRDAPSREAEIARAVRELMAERPDSFKASLIAALLRLAPEEWSVLEKIYDSIEKSPEE